MLLLIQKELINLKKEQEADKKEMLAIISELAKILRKEIICEIETRLHSIPSFPFTCGQHQRSEERQSAGRVLPSQNAASTRDIIDNHFARWYKQSLYSTVITFRLTFIKECQQI